MRQPQGWSSGACTLVLDNVSQIEVTPVVSALFRGCSSPTCLSSSELPFFSGGNTERFACNPRPDFMGTPRGLFQIGEVSVNPLYYLSCGRNNEQQQHPLIILSPHQRQVQYTHSFFPTSNIEIASKFLGRFVTETSEHFTFVIVSIKLSSSLLGEMPTGLVRLYYKPVFF